MECAAVVVVAVECAAVVVVAVEGSVRQAVAEGHREFVRGAMAEELREGWLVGGPAGRTLAVGATGRRQIRFWVSEHGADGVCCPGWERHREISGG